MTAKPQFSIRFLLVLTAAVAAAVAATRAEESWQAAMATDFFTLLFATGSVVGVLQTGGKLRTFWIGTAIVLLFTTATAIVNINSHLRSAYIGRPWNATGTVSLAWAFWYLAPINGLFAVALHWLFTPRQKPPSN